MQYLRALWNSLLHPQASPTDSSLVRAFLAKPRVYDLISAFLQLRQSARIAALPAPAADDDSPRARTIRHNQAQIMNKTYTRTRRVEAFYRIATTPPRDVSRERVLIVGGRAINEFFAATLYGFRWENLTGADLFSAHPKILSMDMHALDFAEGTFDVVTMINTLAYSVRPELAISEAMRVLKPGGRFVFNHIYCGESEEFSQTATVPGNEILAIVKSNGGRVYFHDTSDKTNSHGKPQTSHSIGARKVLGMSLPLDASAI